MTQGHLATRLGVAQGTISNWETGKTEPDKRERQAIDRILGPLRTDTSPASSDASSDETTTAEVPSSGLFGDWLRRARESANLSVRELAEKSGLSPPAIFNIEAGRSRNPRASTRARLEKALQAQVPEDVREDVAEEQKIEGLGELQDFDPHDAGDRPTCGGVYALYDVSDRPVYVGKAKNIRKRLSSHEDKFWFKFPIVSHAAYVEIEDERLRHQVEQILIRFLKSNAVINKQSVDRD